MRGKRMLVVSNMYPDEGHPTHGTFVKAFVEQSEELGWACDLAVMGSANNLLAKTMKYVAFYLTAFLKSLFGRHDIVYVHYPSHSAPPVLSAWRLRKFDLYVNVHGSDVLPVTKKQESMQRYTRASLEAAEKIIVPSEYFEEVVCDKYGLSEGKVYVYPSGGINPSVFHPLMKGRVAGVREELGLEPDRLTVCFVSRITEGKGWDTYLEAVRMLLDRGARLNVLLVGSGDQDAQCSSLAEKLGLDSSITRIGAQPQERLRELYCASDAFVFPGRRRSESLGLVAIEAMACGTPVIASDMAAQGRYVIDGYNGYKVPVADSAALSEAIANVDTSTEAYAAMVRGAFETASRYCGKPLRESLRRILAIEQPGTETE